MDQPSWSGSKKGGRCADAPGRSGRSASVSPTLPERTSAWWRPPETQPGIRPRSWHSTTPAYLSSSGAASTACTTRSRSEEHTSELQSLAYIVCRLLLEKKKHHITLQLY